MTPARKCGPFVNTLGCVAAAWLMFNPLAACAAADPVAEVAYRVTLISKASVVFEGEGRARAGQALALTQHVLSSDNAGHGSAFVDSGFKVVVGAWAQDGAALTSSLELSVAGDNTAAAPALQGERTTLNFKLGETVSAELAGYVVKVEATEALPKADPALPEDFMYLAPSLGLDDAAQALALPNVRFNRQAYQTANAVLARPVDATQTARLVPPLDATPLTAAVAAPALSPVAAAGPGR